MVVAKLIIFIVIGLSSVFAEYTEEDVKNMKMVFCGVCKDDNVRKDLQAYGQCCKANFPEIMDQIMNIRKTMMDKPDDCFAQVRAVLGEYGKKNPDAKKIAEDCFHNNVNKDHLVNCH